MIFTYSLLQCLLKRQDCKCKSMLHRRRQRQQNIFVLERITTRHNKPILSFLDAVLFFKDEMFKDKFFKNLSCIWFVGRFRVVGHLSSSSASF